MQNPQRSWYIVGMSVQVIPIKNLSPPRILLRPVDRNGVEYLELRDSMSVSGQLNSILARPVAGGYEIVDGMYRYTAASELNWATLDCSVRDVSDELVILMQLQCNSIRPETNPIDFAKALKKILNQNEGMDLVGLSSLVKKSPKWIKTMLGLLKLRQKYQVGVNRGIMPLSNAYKLSKLPGPLQDEMYESACIMPVQEFGLLANQAILQFKAALKTGKLERFRSKFVDFKPYLKTLKDLQFELDNSEDAGVILAKYPPKHMLDAFLLGIKFSMNIDPHTLDLRRLRYETIEEQRAKKVEPFKQQNLNKGQDID